MDALAIPKNAHLWERHPQDWYVEPAWVDVRLFAVEQFVGGILDPACGLGRIVCAARLAGHHAVGSDLERRTEGFMYALDFLSGDYPYQMLIPEAGGELENIVSNPPFGVADQFVKLSLERAPRKVAMLLPTKWANSMARGKWLETTPLRRVWFIGPRPSMPPGPAIIAGEKPGNGTVDFSWFVWERGYRGKPELGWLRRSA